jgi:hypothetical protein
MPGRVCIFCGCGGNIDYGNRTQDLRPHKRTECVILFLLTPDNRIVFYLVINPAGFFNFLLCTKNMQTLAFAPRNYGRKKLFSI